MRILERPSLTTIYVSIMDWTKMDSDFSDLNKRIQDFLF